MKTNNLNKDNILSCISPIDITLNALGLTELPNKNISSPFTVDKNPSFKIFKNGKFYCYSTGKNGDCFQLVAELNKIDCKNDFKKVLELVVTNNNLLLQLDNNYTIPHKTTNKNNPVLSKHEVATETTTNINLKAEKIEFQKRHLDYWLKFGVNKELLSKYNVNAISSYSFYSENKSKNLNFKLNENEIGFSYEVNSNIEVYIPKQNTRDKCFINSLKSDDIFGLQQVATKVECIIISAGKKDALTLIANGFTAVSFRSENQHITDEQFQKLQNSCNQLFICYDNDKAGENAQKRIIEKYPEIIPLQLPNDINDVADFYSTEGKTKFIEHIKKEIAIKDKTNLVETLISESETLKKYNFPTEINNPEEYVDDIEKYKLFMANNQIWVATSQKNITNFNAISNFEIKILQHIQDEKYPLKLIYLKNIYGLERVFDIPSEKINTQQKFDDTITSYGNFLWFGNAKEFQLLRAYLFDKMKNGKKIECLGWNSEFGVWVWNNRIKTPSSKEVEIDRNGIFEMKNTSIYVPSANRIYKNNEFKFEPQKRFILKYSKVTFEKYLEKFYTVFKNEGLIATLFTLSSIYQDIIVKEIDGFPILFLQGIPSTGKDQLAKCCQSFFGDPQYAINVEAGVSTVKAHIREFAQFTNSVCQFSEYKAGDKQLDGILKGIWDRNGYKRGTIESNVATDTVPILSALILTGNHSPDDEALITRLLWVEMNKDVFNEQEKQNYNELKEITQNGISAYTNSMIEFRNEFQINFRKLFNKNKSLIDNEFSQLESRFSTNYAILLSTFEILSNKVVFPYNFETVFEITINNIKSQKSKLASVGISEKWWTCFAIALETTNSDNRINIGDDFKLEGDNLYFNFSNLYNKVQRIWNNQFRTSVASSKNVQKALKKDKAFLNSIQGTRIGNNNTSAYQFNLEKTPIKNEILNTISKTSNY